MEKIDFKKKLSTLYGAPMPPSTRRVSPVMNRASSEVLTFLFKVPGTDVGTRSVAEQANFLLDLPETAHASR